ncbi:AraC family transcriptional regulator [Achromobacter spanius]|uniref:AraC family transcriptional regulator n=1 Tax=Achromobacter spanius TaxID=217203 RepID=A0A2S5GIG7_9BURK|nr:MULTISPECIES: AraC family transcriptional regulator [Achromobacter]MDX3984667.1 AraC family transcriptional regulator [Achromobacter sp.]PPA72711.1 AraC family transcriptional regulator [Achromobacter spanius]
MPNDASPTDQAAVDALLLSSLEVQSSLYHLGQYCGNWSASTSGRARASFHLILHGQCRVALHDGQGAELDTLTLAAGDGIFFLRDIPHALTPLDAAAPGTALCRAMEPLLPRQADGTGLACGFFQFRPGLADLLADTLPDYLVLRAQDERFRTARGVFDLILAETADTAPTPGGSPVVLERLTDLLIFFMLRHLAVHDRQAYGLFVLARDPAMASLLQAILAQPAAPWSMQDMADRLHMSKATFHRRFTLQSGTTPAQLLQLLRMRVARRYLSQGMGIQDAAERVGYQSQAAFSRVFQRTEGVAPSALRKRPPGGA